MKTKTKSFTALAVLTAFTLLSMLAVCPASAAEFSLTDYADDTEYSVSISDRSVSVGGRVSFSFTTEYPAVSCCVYDGEISFMSVFDYGSGNHGTAITEYDTQAVSVSDFVLSERASRSRYCFAADSSGNVYFCSESDSRTVFCRSRTGTGCDIHCDYSVKQLLCVDGKHILLVTSGGVYTVNSNSAVLSLSVAPAIPLRYCGGGILRDGGNAEYSYSGGELTMTDSTQSPPDTVKLKYDIRDGVIFGIKAGSTVKTLRDEFAAINQSITVTKKDGKKVSSGVVGTGMTVQTQNLGRLTILIPGDLTGEGNVNSRDLRLIMDKLIGAANIDGIYLLAADLDGDRQVTTKDMLATARLKS